MQNGIPISISIKPAEDTPIDNCDICAGEEASVHNTHQLYKPEIAVCYG